MDTQHGVSDSHLLVVLADFAVGGYVSRAGLCGLQVRGWVRVDRYGSPVLTHAGAEAVRGIGHEA